MAAKGNFSPMQQWEEVFEGQNKRALEGLLPGYLRGCRWFGGKARDIEGVDLAQVIPLKAETTQAHVALVQVHYAEGEPQTYVLPLNYATGSRARQIEVETPQAGVCRYLVEGQEGALYDATWDREFAGTLLSAVRQGRRFGAGDTVLVAWPTAAFVDVLGLSEIELEAHVLRGQQSNTSIAYGERAILKMFRRLEEGTSPDLEVGRFLGRQGFTHTPPLAGALEFSRDEGEPLTLAILQGFVPNKGDAWQYTLDSLNGYFNHALSGQASAPSSDVGEGQLLDRLDEDIPEAVREALGPYLGSARLLGRRTAEMHAALASDASDPAFAPEPFTRDYSREMYRGVQALTTTAFRLLENRLDSLPEGVRGQAREVIGRQASILQGFEPLLGDEVEAARIRCHGDYHLGQALYTGDDFVIIDFEGEPVRSLAERRLKHSPLKDVAGMLRSFGYAAYAALFSQVGEGLMSGEETGELEAWAAAWQHYVSAAFLSAYLAVAEGAGFLPQKREDLRTLLDVYLLEKAVYELIYELNNRPDWVRIPLQGIRALEQRSNRENLPH